MNSVLLIGNSQFISNLRSQVRGLDSLTVTTALSASAATCLMESSQPDVLIIKASALTDRSINKTFGLAQDAYTLVIERTWPSISNYHELTAFLLENTSSALESGADAYLWLPPYDAFVSASPTVLDSAASGSVVQKPMLQDVKSSNPKVKTIQSEITTEQKIQNPTTFDQSSGQTAQNLTDHPSDSSSSESPSDDSLLDESQLNRQAAMAFDASNPIPSDTTANDDLFTRLSVSSKAAPARFHPDQCRLIQAHLQVGLSRSQRYRDLSRINDWLSAMALVDALTQIGNRRAFDLELPNQLKMARAKNMSLSLMVIDIDYFKLINDRFGHLVGDEILKQLAERLLANMRFYDTPFRFGGEEFIVTLSDTGIAEGSAIANRLREIIVGQPFQLIEPIDGLTAVFITVSIGITELTDGDDEQGTSLIDRADKNLLQAKASGRNQVVATVTS